MMVDEKHAESLDPLNWKDMRLLAHRVVDESIDFLEKIREEPVWKAPPQNVLNALSSPAPKAPEGAEKAYQDYLEQILPYQLGNAHPQFSGWYLGGGTAFGALAEYLAAVGNNSISGGNHIGVHVESQVLNWCKDIVGFPVDASGLLVSGTSMATIVAMAVARNASSDSDIRKDGLSSSRELLTCYVSSEAHCCVQRALELLGLGTRAMRVVPVDEFYRMDVHALEKMMITDRAKGMKPFFVVATAGTTNTGAIDNLDALSTLCARQNIWLHVDGAIGAVLTLSAKHRNLVSGIEAADSLAMDFHKWMNIPFSAGCVLVRDAALHHEAFTVTPAYLEPRMRGISGGDLWLSDYGPELSRDFKALKIWLSVKEHGLNTYGKLIEKTISIAQAITTRIEGHDKLELMAPTTINVVCFRYNPCGFSDQELNELNEEILMRLHEDGMVVPSYTKLGGRFCLRAAIVNHRTTLADAEAMITTVINTANAIIQETPTGINRKTCLS